MNFLANPIPIFNLKFFIYLFLMKDETPKNRSAQGLWKSECRPEPYVMQILWTSFLQGHQSTW